MKRTLFLFIAIISVGIVWAQNKITKPKTGNAVPKARYPFKASPVYLGHSNLRGGAISKHMFDSLINEGLFAIDSAGAKGDVIEFRIYYKQRSLYEDSVGNFYTDMEMLTDMSKGNKLNSYVAIQDRTKRGDTAIFDDILVRLPDSLIVRGTAMKFVITK
jgi:hypothetical protein